MSEPPKTRKGGYARGINPKDVDAALLPPPGVMVDGRAARAFNTALRGTPTPLSFYGPTQLWRFLGERRDTPFEPFPAQVELFRAITIPYPGMRADGEPNPSIFALNCGRRFGKTTVLEKLLWQGLTAPEDRFGPPTVRMTADTEEHAFKVWDRFLSHLYNTPLVALLESHSRERHLVRFKSGADAQLLSANNPAALSGDGVSTWIVDEAQDLSQEAFDNLYPSTAERNGVVILAGVSQHQGPFREISYRGDHPDEYPDYRTLRYTSYDNPFVPRWRIEQARRTLSPDVFAQLYLAQWVSDSHTVFRNVNAQILDNPIHEHVAGWGLIDGPRPGFIYYGGIDLARLSDWTVVTIFDHAGRLVAWDRFTLVDWQLQKARIISLSREYGDPLFAVDSTGLGDPMVAELQSSGLNITPVQIGGNSLKRNLVDSLAVEISACRRTYPRIGSMLEELTRYEASYSKVPGSNVVTYAAPAGAHDDWIMSMSLANSLMPRTSSLYMGALRDAEREPALWESI